MTTLETPENEVRVGTSASRTLSSAGQNVTVTPLIESKPKSQRIRREFSDDHICVLTFDRPDSSANIFDSTTLVELNAHLDAIEKDSQIRGLVITSAKK